jgi:nicotinate phosphoribosyltransferase
VKAPQEATVPDPEGILFTDQYQLTMAQLYLNEGMAEAEARFDYFFRDLPDYGAHRAGFAVFAGLGPLMSWMATTRAGHGDLDYLRTLRDGSGGSRFGEAFLNWLEDAAFAELEVVSIAEGRVVHPGEPVVSIAGPLALCQLLETALLNHLNYPTLIATKAARVALAAEGRAVLEFGMRRGPSFAANAAARAAVIGGAVSTSNVGAAAALGRDPRGTHAHSMVQAFVAAGGGEIDAFRAYARTYPDDCLLLVDTIDTLESGVPNAITVFRELAARGHLPAGIRLDSGDLARLTVTAARLLDDAGFADTSIVLSSDLDEEAISTILSRIRERAPAAGIRAEHVIGRLVFGVGTRLITSHGDSALNGVYKLAALNSGGGWVAAAKKSDTPGKATLPGRKQLWRLYDHAGSAVGDLIGLESDAPPQPGEPGHATLLSSGGGHRVSPASVERLRSSVSAAEEPIDTICDRRRRDVGALPGRVLDSTAPGAYPVLITPALDALRRGALGD